MLARAMRTGKPVGLEPDQWVVVRRAASGPAVDPQARTANTRVRAIRSTFRPEAVASRRTFPCAGRHPADRDDPPAAAPTPERGPFREPDSERPDPRLQGDDRQGHERRALAAPGLRRLPPALQQRLSCGREHPGVARSRAGRPLRGGVAEIHGGEPASRHARPRLLSPLRVVVQSQAARPAGVDPLSRSLSRRPRQRPGLAGRDRAADRQARPGRRRRARVACPAPTSSGEWDTTSKSATPAPSRAA